MSGWKTVPWDGVSTSKETLEREFRDQGELVSLCREPPQNTTDNPCIDFDDEGRGRGEQEGAVIQLHWCIIVR